MERIELKANVRSNITPNAIRRQGNIPAVVYGHNVKNQNLEVRASEFLKVFKKAGESTILRLLIDDQDERNVIINDAQKHYLNGKIQHIDFYEVSMTEKMHATVPLNFVGVSKAVKESNGVLVQVINEVEVECLPADLPHMIDVDISSLNTFEDAVHVKDLQINDKVKVLQDAEEIVAKVAPPRDIEKELQSQLGDISAVEGATETEPSGAEATEPAEAAQGQVAETQKKE